jgi:hypothetical protein
MLNGEKMEGDSDDEVVYEITPKGFLCYLLHKNFAASEDEAEDIRLRFEAFCVKRLHSLDPTATFACLVFDGEGGSVAGAEEF